MGTLLYKAHAYTTGLRGAAQEWRDLRSEAESGCQSEELLGALRACLVRLGMN